jgi:hypothetical protein
MLPYPPYTVVARTGRFCFNFPSQEEMGESGHPYSKLGALPAWVGRKVYKCPRIHFVAGMVDKVDDPTRKLVISYGVNDCFSRFIIIDKTDVVRMLFSNKTDF